MTDVAGAACIVDPLEQDFAERPAVLEGREVTARPSIGVAALEPELDVDAMLRRADQAMYAIKRAKPESTDPRGPRRRGIHGSSVNPG